MAEVAVNEAGEAIKWDRQTRGWIPASSADLEAAQSGLGGGFLPGAAKLGGRLLGRKGADTMAKRIAQANKTATQGFVPKMEQRVPKPFQGATRLLEGGLEGTVVGRLMTDYMVRNPNQRNLNSLILKGLGATDDQIAAAGGQATDDVMRQATATRSAKFEEVGSRITQAMDKEEVTKMGLDLNRAKMISNDDLVRLADGKDLGRELMSIRSELLAATRGAQTRSEKIAVDNAIKAIDDIVKKAMKDSGDEVTVKLWADVRSQDKLARAVNAGQARSMDAINPNSLDTAMKRYFGKAYTEGGDLSNLPTEVADAITGARAAKGFNVGLPSSGTAERAAAMGLLKGVGVAGAAAAGFKIAQD